MRASVSSHSRVVLACVWLVGMLASVGARGQAAPQPSSSESNSDVLQEVVVTGSRIRREGKDTTTSAPISVVPAEAIADRGFVSAAQAVQDLTSAIGSATPLSPNQGSATAVNGAQYINLFNLGAERTLTLVNGRRFVSSAPPNGTSNPAGNDLVDPNLIPVGLIDHIEVDEAGGAAVYGSDAIAGVVNYVLKDHFQGIEFDGQTGESTYHDYPVRSARLTVGTDFAGSRGNVAFDVEDSTTGSLLYADRPATSTDFTLTPGNQVVSNPHFWEFTDGGLPFSIPAPVPSFLVANASGTPLQFNSAGNLVPYDPGTPFVPFGSGGDGVPYGDLSSLYAGVKRANAYLMGHYDITDSIKVSVEAMYAHVESIAPYALTEFNSVLQGNAIAFTSADPRLTSSAAAELQSLGYSPSTPLFLSKAWTDLLSNNSFTTETNVKREVVALDGAFTRLGRDFYWDLSASYGEADGSEDSWDVNAALFNDDLNNVIASPTGTPICGPDALPGCSPLNPFGDGTVTAAQRSYLGVLEGDDYRNEQTDLLSTLGGSVVDLPAGALKFSLGFEHRNENGSFTPTEASQEGIGLNNNSPVLPSSGSYHTNEGSLELEAPLVAGKMAIPAVHTLDLDGAVRLVSNSIAGSNTAWNAGLRWSPVQSVLLRATHSSNFRAPSVTQIFAPTASGLGPSVEDPCSSTWLFQSGQPNQAARLAHCQADWAAHGQYGGNPLSADAASASQGIGFTDGNDFVPAAQITNSANPALRNERAVTNSFGIILQPSFMPGFTLAADRVTVDIENGMVTLDMPTLLSLCYDQPVYPNPYCSLFARDPNTGDIISGHTLEAVNAAQIQFHGETYNLRYNVPVKSIVRSIRDWGDLAFDVQSTHTTHLTTSIIPGGTPTRTDGTPTQPTWVWRFDAHYSFRKLTVSYELNYLPRTAIASPISPQAPFPYLAGNIRHNLSLQYRLLEQLSVRAGVINLTNEAPSFPSITYGDVVGRQWFAGFNLHF